MGSLWRLVRVLVVPCGRRGFGILALAFLALGLHIWIAGSVLAPFVRDGEVEYLFVSANAGTVAGSMLAAGLLVFGLHGLVRRAVRRVAPCGARTEHDLFAPSDVAWDGDLGRRLDDADGGVPSHGRTERSAAADAGASRRDSERLSDDRTTGRILAGPHPVGCDHQDDRLAKVRSGLLEGVALGICPPCSSSLRQVLRGLPAPPPPGRKPRGAAPQRIGGAVPRTTLAEAHEESA